MDAVPKDWLEPHRSPILFERDGIHHVVIWVGEDFYPSMWDYIEETRVAGSSRRVPSTFDFSKLTRESRQYFVHARAAAYYQYEKGAKRELLETHCPVDKHPPKEQVGRACLGFAKYIREDTPGDYKEETLGPTGLVRTLPCGHSYEVYDRPDGVLVAAEPAVFLALPISGVAMVNKGDGSFDEQVEARVAAAKVETYRVDQ